MRSWEEVIRLRNSPEQVRNLCILAHVDHGKTSLSDSLISSNKIISPKLAGKLRYLDSRPDEQERFITMKSSSISLLFTEKETPYLINLIDSPGHVDFSSEVAAALRVCDGALVLVDVVEGVCSQTYSVLRQSWEEGIKLCLVLNKIDRFITELKLTPAEAYRRMYGIIEHVNSILSGFYYEKLYSKSQNEGDEEEDKLYFSPEKCNVAFCSAVDRWGFTLKEMANLYASKMGFNPRALCSCLWGENYFIPKTKKVTKKAPSSESEPMFVKFVLEPLWRLYSCTLDRKDPDKLVQMLEAVNVTINPKDLSYITKEPRNTLQAAMSTWLPLDRSLFSLIIRSLPSPIEAQKHRAEYLSPNLHTQHPDLYRAISSCDCSGPITGFISKMMPIDPKIHIPRMPGQDNSQLDSLIAFARVFSGRLERGSSIQIVENKGDVIECIIDHLYIFMGQYLTPVDSAPAGSIVGLGSLQDIVFKTATFSSDPNCPSFTPVSVRTHAIVKVAVEPVQLYDMHRLVQGLKMLDKADNSVRYYVQENGEHILEVCGEVHLQRCIKDLEETYAKVPVTVSEPIVSFRETITSISSSVFIDSTPNKRCTISIRAATLPGELTRFLDDNVETVRQLYGFGAILNDTLRNEFNSKLKAILEEQAPHLVSLIFDHLLCFGPKKCGNNMLVYTSSSDSILTRDTREDTSNKDQLENDCETESTGLSKVSISSLSDYDIQSALITGFQLGTSRGPLCDEPLQGVLIILENIEVLEQESGVDPYGPFQGQIIATMKDVIRETVLKSAPRLVEGVYDCTFNFPQEAVGKLYAVLNKRRGEMIEEIPQEGTSNFVCKGYLPVAESFGFSQELLINTSGEAVPQLNFSHWKILNIDPFYIPSTLEELEEFGENGVPENLAKKLINRVRRRKGLPTDEQLVVHSDKQRTLTKMR